MKLFRSKGVLGTLVLVGLAGCSGAVREASKNILNEMSRHGR